MEGQVSQPKYPFPNADWNGYHLILKAISHINFNDIKQLFLNGNRIISI